MTTRRSLPETLAQDSASGTSSSSTPIDQLHPKGATPSSSPSATKTEEKQKPAENNKGEEGERMNSDYYSKLPGEDVGQNNNSLEYATHTAHQIVMNSESTKQTVGNSVVQDLMKVYENLTQSSTPQIPHAGGDTAHTHMSSHHHEAPAPASPSKYHIPPPMFHVPTSRGSDGNERRGHRPSQQQSAASHENYTTSSGSYHFEPSRHPKTSSVKGETVPPAVSIPSSIRLEDEEDGQQQELANEESDEQSIPSSRRKRRGSHDNSGSVPRGGGGSSSGSASKPKKKSKQDGKWSKRFSWPEDLHRDFVSAIFDVGLKQSSPSTILEHMPKHEQITTERIKSHLQKYRLHRAKSKKEFISSYEASLRKLNNQAGETGGVNTIAGGEVAAHLTFVHAENDDGGTLGVVGAETLSPTSTAAVSSDNANPKGSRDPDGGSACANTVPSMALRSSQESNNECLMLPELTEVEKQAPIGAAMGYLMGLFFSLRQQLMIQRSLESARGSTYHGNVPVQDVYSSFVAGNAPSTVPAGSEYAPDGMMTYQQTIPSMRTNIEQNSMMKREMQNQMALQNKMRALKEQELAKYKNIDQASTTHSDSRKTPPSYLFGGSKNEMYSSKSDGGIVSTSIQVMSQGPGELAGNDVSDTAHRPHGLSFGNTTDLWNSDVVDEQLFEFLLND